MRNRCSTNRIILRLWRFRLQYSMFFISCVYACYDESAAVVEFIVHSTSFDSELPVLSLSYVFQSKTV